VLGWSNNSTEYGWYRSAGEQGWVDAGSLPAGPHIAVTSDGTATAAWIGAMTLNTQTLDISAGTLEPVEPVAPISSGNYWDCQIVASLDRVALFGARSATTGDDILVAWRDKTSGWGPAEPIASASDIRAWRTQSDEQGNIAVLWAQADQFWSRIYVRQNESWGRPQLVTTATTDALPTDLQMAAGNIVVPLYWDSVPHGAYYEHDIGWVEASIVDFGRLNDIDLGVQISIDRRGNALAVGRTGYQRYLPGKNWQSPVEHGLELGPWRLWLVAATDGGVLAVTHDLTINDELIPEVVRFE